MPRPGHRNKHIESETDHEFTLLLDRIGDLTPEEVDALYEAGCDDGTISARNSRWSITFDRLAPSLKDAVIGAIKIVRDAGIGVKVVRVDHCDLVTQAEIARRIDRTRQMVHHYISGARGLGGFPPPACYITDDSPLWFWCEVAHWLWENDMVKEEVLRDARELAVINHILDLEQQKNLAPEATGEILQNLSAVLG